MPVDALGLEVGYRLIPLVDTGQDGELLRRIKAIRQEVRAGHRLPAAAGAHSRQPRACAQRLPRSRSRASRSAQGECHPGMYLAINPGRSTGTLPGIADHAIRRSACRRSGSKRRSATPRRRFGYTVVDRRHRGRDASFDRRSRTCCGAARPPGSAGIARPGRQGGRRSWSRTSCPSCCRWRRCSECCRTCSTKACTSATCARSSRRSPIMRRARRIPAS